MTWWPTLLGKNNCADHSVEFVEESDSAVAPKPSRYPYETLYGTMQSPNDWVGAAWVTPWISVMSGQFPYSTLEKHVNAVEQLLAAGWIAPNMPKESLKKDEKV